MSIPAPFQQVWGTNGVMESSFPRQITVAACQVRPGSDVDENLELARRSVADAAARGAQIVVLPEATMVRFGVDPRPVAQPLDGPFAEGVRAVAREFGVLVVVGMFTPSDDGRVFNTVLATDGAAVEAHYDKVHLFDAYGTRESERTAPGREYVTFEALGTRIGLAACYDVRFADQFTAMGRAGGRTPQDRAVGTARARPGHGRPGLRRGVRHRLHGRREALLRRGALPGRRTPR